MSNKKVVAVSRGQYRGVQIIELANGLLSFCLGTLTYTGKTLVAVTKFIDDYFSLKQN